MNAISQKIALLLIVPALAAGFAGCADDDADSVTASEQKIVLEQTDTHRALEIRSNTSWSAECFGLDQTGEPSAADAWFELNPNKGVGTMKVALDVLTSNMTSKTRKGSVVVSYANGQTYTIDIEQRGLTAIECGITPEQIGIGAKPSTGNTFTVFVENRDAVITVTPDANAAWLKNLKKGYDLSYGYSRKEVWSFDAEENVNSDSRKAVLDVEIVFGYNTYKYTVTVTQDGLGAPAIKTPAVVYMNGGQTSHTQSVWIEGGDKANVQYDVTWTSSYEGVGNTAGWITKAEIVNDRLVVTAAPNTDDAAREGSVMIVAKRPSNVGEAAYASLSVKVMQAGHQAAGIVLPVSEAVHPYTESAYSQQLVLLNGSTVKSVTTDDATLFKAAPAVAGGVLTYTLNPYDGSRGDYREATVTIIAGNGHSNDAIAALTVRQYGPEMPAISMPAGTLICSHAALTDALLPLNPQNASALRIVATSKAWLTAKIENGMLTYSATAYDGSEGDFREGVVTIEAKNAHADAAYYYITVRQYAPEMPAVSALPEYLGLGHAAATATLDFNPQNGATVTVVNTSANWLTASIAGNALTYTVTANTAASAADYFREGVITLKAANANADAVYYYLTVRQYARDMAYVTPASISMSGHTYANTNYTYPRAQTVRVNNVPKGSDKTVTWTTAELITNLKTANSSYKFSFTAGTFENEIVVSHYYYSYGNADTLINTANIYITVNAYPYKQYFTVPCTMTHTYN